MLSLEVTAEYIRFYGLGFDLIAETFSTALIVTVGIISRYILKNYKR